MSLTDVRQASSSNTVSLETLPAEIKLMILKVIPSTLTLKHFIKASPDYHAVYARDREEIFTRATLRDLSLRGIDIFQMMHQARLSIYGPRVASHYHLLKRAVESSVQQLQNNQRPILAIEQCLALLTIYYLEPRVVLAGKNLAPIVKCSPPPWVCTRDTKRCSALYKDFGPYFIPRMRDCQTYRFTVSIHAQAISALVDLTSLFGPASGMLE